MRCNGANGGKDSPSKVQTEYKETRSLLQNIVSFIGLFCKRDLCNEAIDTPNQRAHKARFECLNRTTLSAHMWSANILWAHIMCELTIYLCAHTLYMLSPHMWWANILWACAIHNICAHSTYNVWAHMLWAHMLWIAQAFAFELGGDRFKVGELCSTKLESYSSGAIWVLLQGAVFHKVIVILPTLIWPHCALTFARSRPDV